MTDDVDEAFFRKISWCVKLMEDPAFYPIPTLSRQPKSSTEDSLLAESLSTKPTVNAWLSFGKKPDRQGSAIKEVRMLISLGSGLNGYPHICHGGILGTLMDEAMGMLLSVNKTNMNGGQSFVTGDAVTARLNITFLKAVATPQVIIVTASFRNIEGRKYYVEASIKDGCEALLATADSLWIQTKQENPRL